MAEPWWHSFFDDTYAEVGLSTTPPEALAGIVDFLLKTLNVTPGNRVLDQCCGIGRVAVPLAARGVRVVGVDQVAGYLDRAKKSAAQQGVNVELHCADAFEFVADPPCDGAFNWFTSCGYSEDDEVNIRMFQRAFESLRSGGRYAVDYPSLARVFANFRSRHFTEMEDNGVIVLETATPDFARGVMESDWTFIHPDGRRAQRRICTRLYLPHEIVALLRRCGFREVELYGSTSGEPYERHSPRCIAVARK